MFGDNKPCPEEQLSNNEIIEIVRDAKEIAQEAVKEKRRSYVADPEIIAAITGVLTDYMLKTPCPEQLTRRELLEITCEVIETSTKPHYSFESRMIVSTISSVMRYRLFAN